MSGGRVRRITRVLVVDDDEHNARMMGRLFRKDFEVQLAHTGEDALADARHFEPHVVVTDQRMPGMSGVELLVRIQEMFPLSIRILATGHADYGPLVDAVNAAGIDLYVEKPFHVADLKGMVDALVERRELQIERETLLAQLQESESRLQRLVEERTSELKDANRQLADTNERLRDLVVRDGLTQVYNHRYMLEYLGIEVARSRRYQRSFGVLFLDLDDFKSINDRFGHRCGDEVLIRVAKHLRPAHSRMRKSDFAARYGGEEFVLILPETDLQGSKIKAERLRSAVEQIDFSDVSPDLVENVTVSIGIAIYPTHSDNADGLLQVADAALYSAKHAGKNCVRVSRAMGG